MNITTLVAFNDNILFSFLVFLNVQQILTSTSPLVTGIAGFTPIVLTVIVKKLRNYNNVTTFEMHNFIERERDEPPHFAIVSLIALGAAIVRLIYSSPESYFIGHGIVSLISWNVMVHTVIVKIFVNVAIYVLMATFHIFILSKSEEPFQPTTLWIHCNLLMPTFLALSSMIILSMYSRKALLDAARLNDSLEKANNAKSNFLRIISHEIRTPLNAILGTADLLSSREFAKTERESFLHVIKLSGTILLDNFTSILEYVKLESEQSTDKNSVDVSTISSEKPVAQVTDKEFSFGQFLQDISELIRVKAAGTSSKFILRNSCNTIDRVLADKKKLREILMSLLSNACKFTKHGEVRLTVSHISSVSSDELLFEVKDTGIGIPASFKSKMFQPFTQYDMGMSRKYEGIGLGLCISQALCRCLNGKIWFESEEGKGTTFYFKVPVKIVSHLQDIGSPKDKVISLHEDIITQLTKNTFLISNSPSALSSPNSATNPTASVEQPVDPLHVLVVDDNKLNIKVLSKMLTQLNHPHKTCYSGTEALELVKQEHFDVILLDINMPGISGIEVAKQIHQDYASSAPTIYYVSGADVIDSEAMKYAKGFIQKPLRLTELIRLLNDEKLRLNPA